MKPTEFVTVLERLRAKGLDDHECVIFLQDTFPGSGVQRSEPRSRKFILKQEDVILAGFNINKNGRISLLEIRTSDLPKLEAAEKLLTDQHPLKVLGTTVFTTRPICGYAKVDGWLQIRAIDNECDDLTLVGRSIGLAVADGRPFPLSLEVCYSPSLLPFMNAHRWLRAVNEAIWLLTAFLELPVFQPRSPFAYAMVNQRMSLVQCSAPALTNSDEFGFSNVSGLAELKPIEHEKYFLQLGIGHAEFRVPNLALLRAAYLGLGGDNQKRFLRACANLFDSANPCLGDSGRIVAAVSAIEALLDDGERCEKCESHIGISKNFKEFVRTFVAPDDGIISLYDDLYPSRSKLAHGARHLDVDEPLFGFSSQDRMVMKLVAWSAAKRGLINWLFAQGQLANSDPSAPA